MNDGSVPPNRKDSSLEMTAVMPRAPLSTPMLSAMDLDPNNPETREMRAEASVNDRRAALTLVECPACIANPCPCCAVVGMTEPAKAARYTSLHAALASLDDPPDEVA